MFFDLLCLAIILFSSIALCLAETSIQPCESYSECASCASHFNCYWCGSEINGDSNVSFCYDRIISKDLCIHMTSYAFEDTCPVLRIPTKTELYLSNWIGELLPIVGHLTVMDISLPGTHNTFTYDLSLTVSDGGIDGAPMLAQILHDYSNEIPDGIEDYVRQQGQIQDLEVTQQLNNGIRFIDARMMYEYSSDDDGSKDWYSLHLMQTNNKVMKYYNEIYQWMSNHPEEIVVMWISKHGSTGKTGDDQYPNVSIEEKQSFWQQIVDLFQDVLVDVTVSPINSTTISELIERNHRLYIYASDYVELTNSSIYALDAKLIEKVGGPDVTNETYAVSYEESVFSNALNIKEDCKANQTFYLMNMATGVPGQQMWYAFKIKYLPHTDEDIYACAEVFNIPNMTTWCPPTNLDIASLENFYKQITLEETMQTLIDNVFPEGVPETLPDGQPYGSYYREYNQFTNQGLRKAIMGIFEVPTLNTSWGFPQAIHISSVDVDGTIRTGTQTLWGGVRNDEDLVHQETSYAYSSTLILYNALFGCFYGNQAAALSSNDLYFYCMETVNILTKHREAHPYERWDDTTLGRWETWPLT